MPLLSGKLLRKIPPINRLSERLDLLRCATSECANRLGLLETHVQELTQTVAKVEAVSGSPQAAVDQVGADLDSSKEPGSTLPTPVHRAAAASFEQLLNRDGDDNAGDVVFYPAVPKTGCNTINELLRQNSYWQLDLHYESNDFFYLVDEDRWQEQRLLCLFAGHYTIGHPRLFNMDIPFVVIATLRDPIDRVLSAYNYTLVHPSLPYHDEIGTGSISFLEYAETYLEEIGPQYRFFDDTTDRHTAPGSASVQQCLDNLLARVSCYGFTDRLEEFAIILGYLLKFGHVLTVGRINRTEDMPNPDGKLLKSSVTEQERRALERMLESDLWFYHRAREVYERRTSDQRLQSVLAEAAPLRRACQEAAQALHAIEDPLSPGNAAFGGLRFRGD